MYLEYYDMFSIRVYLFETGDVLFAENPSLDAWLGAKKWVTSANLGNVWITRQDYDEMGPHYLKEHTASNRYLPSPVLAQK